MEDNTLGTTSYVLTMDTLNEVLVDAAHMPEKPAMGWFASIYQALYFNLKYHAEKKIHYKKFQLKKIVCTLREMFFAAKVHVQDGKLQKYFGRTLNMKDVDRLLKDYSVFYLSPAFDVQKLY